MQMYEQLEIPPILSADPRGFYSQYLYVYC